MYSNEAERSPTSPEPHSVEIMSGQDPFYDRFPFFKLIGRSVVAGAFSCHCCNCNVFHRSFIYLSNLLYPGLGITHRIAVVNEKGDVQGYIRVSVLPVTGKQEYR